MRLLPNRDNTLRRRKFFATFQIWLVAVVGASAALNTSIARAEEIAAVASRVSDDYIRTKLADGSFQTETYAFGEGGYSSGNMRDPSIDKITFMEVARTMAGALRGQGYVSSGDANETKLLIMVYWGTTKAPEHASQSVAYQNFGPIARELSSMKMAAGLKGNQLASDPLYQSLQSSLTSAVALIALENHQRDKANAENAALLGYGSWWEATAHAPAGTSLESRRTDMISELEENRYFVVLMAYDFQLMWKQKKAKLLWETRFSISQHRNEFDRQLAAMALQASKFFGQDSHGLQHKEIPDGRVEMGELRTVSETPEKSSDGQHGESSK